MQPGVVLDHAAVGHSPVSAGEPGDGAFDHGPVPAVVGLEVRLGSARPMFPLERVVGMKVQVAAAVGGGAAGAYRAAAAGRAEVHVPGARDGPGDFVWAGRGAGGLIDGEVIEGEPAGHDR